MRPPGRLLSVNIAHVRPNPYKSSDITGIDKRPVTGPVEVSAPGMKDGGAGSGLAGDKIGDRDSHGGDDQAVYAYAREDLDRWEQELGRTLTSGSFGENLTTQGIDVNGALIGERWAIGDDVVLEVTSPRVPCSAFRGWMGIPGCCEGTLVRVDHAAAHAARPGLEVAQTAKGSPVANASRASTSWSRYLARTSSAKPTPPPVLITRRPSRKMSNDLVVGLIDRVRGRAHGASVVGGSDAPH